MNKFLLIAGNNYDSCHGLEDYAGTYDTLDEAFEAGDKLVECDDNNIDWFQILDCNNPTGYYSNSEHKNKPITFKPTQPMKTFKKYLHSVNACQTAIDWAGDKTIEQVVADCHRGDWLLWLAKKCGVELQPLTLAKAHCANTVRHLMTDERSIKAVDVAIAFGEGRATQDELDTAAYANARAAAAAAACAFDDADTAAYANATAAAYAAANASADAYANLRQTADICRKLIGDLIIEKVNQHLNQTNP